MENGFVKYLNKLHNFNAQNQNAYAESNVTDAYFEKVMVHSRLVDYLQDCLSGNEAPHILILTGHAGDGKTSIMYEVLEKLGAQFDPKADTKEITLPTGTDCLCVKDFSELSDNRKNEILSQAVSYPKQGKFVFMIANTGPLINTFTSLVSEDDREELQLNLIDAIDASSGEITEVHGWPIRVINVATVDNTYFAPQFLDKITDPSLWSVCEDCPKKAYCHILRNCKLIQENHQQVERFLREHYTWLAEYNNRLTIRSITEQLAFMMTGGNDCEDVVEREPDAFLFSNLFFGYYGTVPLRRAQKLLSIHEACECNYDAKKLRSDEELLIHRNYRSLFTEDVASIIESAETKNWAQQGWTEFLHRTYFFLNCVADKEQKKRDLEDVFSEQFGRYLQLTRGEMVPNNLERQLVVQALCVLYTGTPILEEDKDIPITLSRESGLLQNVQMVIGKLRREDIEVIAEKTTDNVIGGGEEKYRLYLVVKGERLRTQLTLPLMDYFNDLRQGIIPTNVDPQLSHGVENIKAQIAQIVQEDMSDKDDPDVYTISMNVLRNSGNRIYRVRINRKDHTMGES